MRVSDDFLETIDSWSGKQPDKPARAEAIRRLVEIGLSVPVKAARKTSAAREASAASAEKHATDHMDLALHGESAGVKASRKKQLTSMPGGLKRR